MSRIVTARKVGMMTAQGVNNSIIYTSEDQEMISASNEEAVQMRENALAQCDALAEEGGLSYCYAYDRRMYAVIW